MLHVRIVNGFVIIEHGRSSDNHLLQCNSVNMYICDMFENVCIHTCIPIYRQSMITHTYHMYNLVMMIIELYHLKVVNFLILQL